MSHNSPNSGPTGLMLAEMDIEPNPPAASVEASPDIPGSLHASHTETRAALEAKVPACDAPGCTLLHGPDEPLHPDAQRRWAARPLADRIQILRRARHWIAAHPALFAQAISPNLARSQADTLATEVLPLLDAIRFLERNAQKLLAPRKLGAKHRPLWLTGIHSEVHHDPLGHILIISPANYPLFLAGVQTAQALTAGNAVTWKPGTGGEHVARLFAHVLREAGLPRGILCVTDESVQAAQSALNEHPDKVIFTGSFETGRKLLRTLAETATPAVLELSGADAVIVLPSADLHVAAKAVAFGLRLNGGEVCMSPRRLLATRETLQKLRPLLQTELAKLPPVRLNPRTAETLQKFVEDARSQGAYRLDLGDPIPGAPSSARLSAGEAETKVGAPAQMSGNRTHPILLDHATPETAITRTDLFAPVLSLIEAPSVLHLPDLANNNPYALTAAIFGNPREAQTLATQLRVGTVLINDLIAPTVDPRVPFGGRAHSGYGLTRGAEGLLEMTATKTLLVRRKGMTRQYDPLGPTHLSPISALIGILHAGSLHHRYQAVKTLLTTARLSQATTREQQPPSTIH